MKFTEARRHDSKNFLYAFDDFGRHTYGLTPKNICLDSAHDSIPTYELLEHMDINALIDINGRSKSSENAPDDITFNKAGHLLCKTVHEMSRGAMPLERTPINTAVPINVAALTPVRTLGPVLPVIMAARYILKIIRIFVFSPAFQETPKNTNRYTVNVLPVSESMIGF